MNRASAIEASQGIAQLLVRRSRLVTLKYLAVMRVSIANNLAYIGEVFFRALLLIVLVFVLTQLWQTTFALHGSRMLSGFSIADLVWYLVAAETIALSLPALTRRIDQEVRSGQLAYLLGRPESSELRCTTTTSSGDSGIAAETESLAL